MPMRSKAQRRWMHWAESQGKVPPGTAKKWEDHTPKGKKLPERIGKKKKKMKKAAFWSGFEKKAEMLTKWDAQGGVAPRMPEEMERAQAADLVTLPKTIDGANCGNCRFAKILDKAKGNGMCSNPEVMQEISDKMCCSLWDAPGTVRAWEDRGPPIMPSELAAADEQVQQEKDLALQQGMEGPLDAQGAPAQPPADGTGPLAPGEMAQPMPNMQDGTPAPAQKPAKKPTDKPASKSAPKEKGGGHTINVNVGEKKEASQKGSSLADLLGNLF